MFNIQLQCERIHVITFITRHKDFYEMRYQYMKGKIQKRFTGSDFFLKKPVHLLLKTSFVIASRPKWFRSEATRCCPICPICTCCQSRFLFFFFLFEEIAKRHTMRRILKMFFFSIMIKRNRRIR